MGLDPWGPILRVLFEDKSSDSIVGILQRAGVSSIFNLTKEEAYSHTTRKRAYQTRLDPIYSQLAPVEKHRVAQNLAHELAKSERGLERLNAALERVGWTFQGGELTPLTLGGKNEDSLPKRPSERSRAIPSQSGKESLLVEIEDIIKNMPPRATIRRAPPRRIRFR